MNWFKSRGRKLTFAVAIAAVGLAGTAIAGATVSATPSVPTSLPYTGCFFFYGCPSGASNTKLYTWTVTLPASSGGMFKDSSMTIPAGSTISGVTASATGNLSNCIGEAELDVSYAALDVSYITTWQDPGSLSGTAGQVGGGVVDATSPLIARDVCRDLIGDPLPATAVTITVTFAVTAPPTGTPQTFN